MTGVAVRLAGAINSSHSISVRPGLAKSTSIAHIAGKLPGGREMADRRRSQKGQLRRIADRSPLHSSAMWLIKAAVIGALFLGIWLVVINWAVPSLVEGFVP